MRKFITRITYIFCLSVGLLLGNINAAHADWWSKQRDKVTGFAKDPKNTTSKELQRWQKDASNADPGTQGCRIKANNVMSQFRTTRGLTSLEKKYLAPYFGRHINLDRVSVFWGANLNGEMKILGKTIWVASGAQTFGYRVFFRERHDPGNTRQLIDLAHELSHTIQHEQLGGLTAFCKKYMNGYFNAGWSYENNSLERDAYNNEYKFALQLEHVPSTTGKIIRIDNRVPNNHRSKRSVWVPERVR